MNENRLPLRVVKLGGSLLDWPDLPAGLRDWLGRQPLAGNLLVVGGGRFADAVREYDRQHQLGPPAHWLAIRAMNLAAAMVGQLFPEARRGLRLDDLAEWRASIEPSGAADDLPESPTSHVLAIGIIDAFDFVADLERGDAALRLPNSWDVTSDSIAARLAEEAAASELVLLKSALEGAGSDRVAATQAGLVDRYFCAASRGVARVRVVNLRSAGFDQQWLG